MFLLPYDTHTALFFSQLTLAKDHYCKEREGGREGGKGKREEVIQFSQLLYDN